MEYGKDAMRDLACELVTVSENGAMPGEYGEKECILHIISGKANLIIGQEGGQQWRYPLNAYDSVWIPAGTCFLLKNDGIGGLEVSRYLYGAS